MIGFMLESFERNGKPRIIYVDRHATYKVNNPNDQFNEEMKTRFKRGMETLGVLVIYSKCPEGKGRVERGFGVHQDRLIKEMRVKGIRTYEEANTFLEWYIPYYNAKFGKPPREEGDEHQRLRKEEKEDIERYFAKIARRTVKNNGTISYNNTIYQLEKGTILKSRKITVKESIYGNVRLYD
jgi:hypothetical protein